MEMSVFAERNAIGCHRRPLCLAYISATCLSASVDAASDVAAASAIAAATAATTAIAVVASTIAVAVATGALSASRISQPRA